VPQEKAGNKKDLFGNR